MIERIRCEIRYTEEYTCCECGRKILGERPVDTRIPYTSLKWTISQLEVLGEKDLSPTNFPVGWCSLSTGPGEIRFRCGECTRKLQESL